MHFPAVAASRVSDSRDSVELMLEKRYTSKPVV